MLEKCRIDEIRDREKVLCLDMRLITRAKSRKYVRTRTEVCPLAAVSAERTRHLAKRRSSRTFIEISPN